MWSTMLKKKSNKTEGKPEVVPSIEDIQPPPVPEKDVKQTEQKELDMEDFDMDMSEMMMLLDQVQSVLFM